MAFTTAEIVTIYGDGDVAYNVTRDREGEISLMDLRSDKAVVFSSPEALELVIKTLEKVSRSWY